MEDPENITQSLKRHNEDMESQPDLSNEAQNDNDNSAKKQRVESDETMAESTNNTSDKDIELDNAVAEQDSADPAAEPKDPATGLTPNQTKALELAKQYAREVQEQLVKSGTISSVTEPEPSLAVANLVEQRKSLCRVYVGSISFEATEDDVRQKLSRFGDIKELVLKVDPATGKHRGFCFVEYDLPEAAILAVQASESVDVGGRNIKIGRPKNYDAGVINDLPSPPEDRIYVANIASMVSEADLAGIFAAFGEVEKCVLIPDPIIRKHKGYGALGLKAILRFDPYISPWPFILRSGTAVCHGSRPQDNRFVESMKGFMLLDLAMGVCKALIGGTLPEGMKALDHMPPGAVTVPTPAQSRTTPTSTSQVPVNPAMIAKAQATAASTAQRLVAMGHSSGLNGDRESVASEENMSISGNQRYMVMQSLARSGGIVPPASATAQPEVVAQPTVVRLQYNATPDDIDDQLEEEFSEECSKYGPVVKVQLLPLTDGLLRIFIQFMSPVDARSAAAQLHGRQFDGKTIQASLYDTAEFTAGRLA
ncbi:Poly(U)-binding-splicing factor puf60 [Haplosporangium sp. Z 27]|nr:Poly(U)-binding-splicing factor puf60 [Haplosporangium sp. Z 27]